MCVFSCTTDCVSHSGTSSSSGLLSHVLSSTTRRSIYYLRSTCSRRSASIRGTCVSIQYVRPSIIGRARERAVCWHGWCRRRRNMNGRLQPIAEDDHGRGRLSARRRRPAPPRLQTQRHARGAVRWPRALCSSAAPHRWAPPRHNTHARERQHPHREPRLRLELAHAEPAAASVVDAMGGAVPARVLRREARIDDRHVAVLGSISDCFYYHFPKSCAVHANIYTYGCTP